MAISRKENTHPISIFNNPKKYDKEFYAAKLLTKFGLVLPVDWDPESTFNKIMNDYKSFMASSHILNIISCVNSFNSDFFSLVNQSSLEKTDDSQIKKQITAELEKTYLENAPILTKQKDIQTKIFKNLFTLEDKNPDNLFSALSDLCHINAFFTIDIISKIHPDLTKQYLNKLLYLAVCYLNIETLDILLAHGGNIHQHIIHSDYRDHGFSFYAPLLYYVLALPQDPYCRLGKLNWDDKRLQKMMDFLLSKGADPLLNCIGASERAFTLEVTQEQEMLDENCVTFAIRILQMLEKNGITKEFDPNYLILLNRLANWNQTTLSFKPK